MIGKFTENVFVQDQDTGASLAVMDWPAQKSFSATAPEKFTHAVNFYAAAGSLGRVQELTAESLRRARGQNQNIQLVAVVDKDEPAATPPAFVRAPPLERQVSAIKKFAVPRPLPLVFDIVERAAAVANADGYLIFTNSDICVTPQFYPAIQTWLAEGFDALVINRRTVGELASYGARPELAMLDAGTKHPGFDCFVFPAAWVNEFVRSDSCVGAGLVMRPLLYNLIAPAERLLILKDVHLTYHYGDDAPWREPRLNDYIEHNLAEAKKVYQALQARGGVGAARVRDFAQANHEAVAEPAKITTKPARETLLGGWFKR